MKFSTLVHTDKSIIVTDFFHIQPRLKGCLDFTHLALIKKTHTQLDMPSDLWKRASLINYMGTVYCLDLLLSFIIPYPQYTYPRSGAILQRRWQRGFASPSPNITKTKQNNQNSIRHFYLLYLDLFSTPEPLIIPSHGS